MTDDQEPITPYIENGWLVEPCEPDYAPGISQPIPGTWAKPIVNLAELDGWDELIAAAEQRGAEKSLRRAEKLLKEDRKELGETVDTQLIIDWLRLLAGQPIGHTEADDA